MLGAAKKDELLVGIKISNLSTFPNFQIYFLTSILDQSLGKLFQMEFISNFKPKLNESQT